MTDRIRVSTTWSIRTHMQTKNRPARNCTFFVISGGLQAEHDAALWHGCHVPAKCRIFRIAQACNTSCSELRSALFTISHVPTHHGQEWPNTFPARHSHAIRSDQAHQAPNIDDRSFG